MKRLMVRPVYLALLGYILLVLVVFGQALIPQSHQLIFGDDIHRSYNFFREFFVQSVKAGQFPWWNPYLFGGEPLIANPSNSFWYPPLLVFFILPTNIAYSFLIASHLILAMVGMYWLCSRVFGLPKIAAWAAGCVFGLSGYFMARVWAGHIEILTSAPYIPWVFGSFWRAMWYEGPLKARLKYILTAAGFLSLQIYAGYQTMAFFTMQVVGISMVILVLAKRSFRPLGILVAAVMIALGLSAFQILPSQEFFQQSIRTFPLPYSWASYGAMIPKSFLQLFDPFLYGDQRTFAGPPPNYHEQAMFIGRVGIGLAIMALLVLVAKLPQFIRSPQRLWKDQMHLVLFSLLSVCIYSIWIALGPNATIDIQAIVWKILPIYHYLRFPARHMFLFVFAASVLAGLGLTFMKHKVLQIVIVLAIVFEMVPFAKHFIELADTPSVRHDRELVSYLQKEKEPYRLLQNFGVWVPPRDSLDFDGVMPYKIPSATGYDPAILRSYYQFADAVNGSIEPSILQHDVQIPYLDVTSPYVSILNIKHVLTPSAYDSLGGLPNYSLVSEDQKLGYRLYENTTVYPRFFLTAVAKIYPTRADVLAAIAARQVDLTTTVLLAHDEAGDMKNLQLDCPQPVNGKVNIISYALNTISLNVHTPCNAMLSTSEVQYPGWEAYIDGKQVPLYTGNIAFRTLYIPKGDHRIEFRYFPAMFVWGGMISLGTVLACAGVLRKYS